jgi:hypothetical protein
MKPLWLRICSRLSFRYGRCLGNWNAVKAECVKANYQPVLLLYELENPLSDEATVVYNTSVPVAVGKEAHPDTKGVDGATGKKKSFVINAIGSRVGQPSAAHEHGKQVPSSVEPEGSYLCVESFVNAFKC